MVATLIVLVLGTSFVGNLYYPRLASRCGLRAEPNFRSLHSRPVPRGAGIIIALVSLAAIGAAGAFELMSGAFASRFVIGGAAIALFGLADDRFELPAPLQLTAQVAAAAWLLHAAGGPPPMHLGSVDLELRWAGYGVSAFALVWFFNLFNFMDGIDGMATSGALYITAAAAVMLLLNHDSQLALLSAILAAATAGFLYFNWPPARVFLGDAGSSFLSYAIAGLVIASLSAQSLSLWTWLILLGYFVTDTTTTMLVRVLRVKRWYRAHRSHAYQNLARIWGSHGSVLALVLLVELVWLLPLAILSAWKPQHAPAIATVALLPLGVFALLNGPLKADC